MKAVFLPGNTQVEVREVDPPRPGTGEVLIAVKASCICRSDMSLYYGNAVLPGTTPGTYITGHEPVPDALLLRAIDVILDEAPAILRNKKARPEAGLEDV